MQRPFFYRFDYAIRDVDGGIVDSSAGGEAISFIEGDGTAIPGLEKALKGRHAGDEFQVTIAPDDAYGLSQKSLIRTVSAEMFDVDVERVEVGMIFQVGSGETREVAKVVAVDDDSITIDANHPLAGITFHFDIKVVEVRAATADEVTLASPRH